MALGSCRECGRQISSEARTCPGCGVDNPVSSAPRAVDAPATYQLGSGQVVPAAQGKGMGCVGKAFLGLVGLFAVVFVISAIGGSGSRSSGGGGGAPAGGSSSSSTSAPAGPPMPADQQQFCSIVEANRTEYRGLGRDNELKLSRVRAQRAQALRQAVKVSVTDWVGTVKSLTTTGEGKAHVRIALPCEDVTVGTWNNEMSDIMDNTLIPQSSPIYSALAELGKGRTVKFSGRLLTDDKNGFKESSMTERGSMMEPAFLMKLSAVSSP
jgi:hypothetical protein